jgi:hypothetical protein
MESQYLYNQSNLFWKWQANLLEAYVLEVKLANIQPHQTNI